MDQVDNIIFQNFISLGWDNEEDVKSLQDLEVPEVAKLMIKCLYVINPEQDLPQSLPHNMSQKFRVAAKIAESIKELGYNGDLGYQSILYSNEVDLRKIFTFLIERLPKDAPNLTKEPLGKSYLIQRRACKKVYDALQIPWIPPHCAAVVRKYKSLTCEDVPLTQHGVSHSHSFKTDWLLHQSLEPLMDSSKSNSITAFKCSHNKVFPTLLNSHAEQLGKSLSKFESQEHQASLIDIKNNEAVPNKAWSHSQHPKFDCMKRSDLVDAFQVDNLVHLDEAIKEETVLESLSEMTTHALEASTPIQGKETDIEKLLKSKAEDNDKKFSDLRLQISSLQEEIVEIEGLCNEKEAMLVMLEQTVEKEKKKLANQERRLTLMKKTSYLASDVDTNLQKLKNSLQASKEKEEKLMKQWLAFKHPLEKELEAITLKLENKRSKQMEIEAEILECRRATQVLAEEAKKKEIVFAQLREQNSKLAKGVNRAVYTKQILDISSKVQRQKQEIKKILVETRVVQKEINTLTGKLQRTFAVVEDTSFKAASANERARPIYRSVITIHEEFGALVDVTRETGSIQREIADLQQQLNSEKSKNIEENLRKLQEDYNKMKVEHSSAALKQSSKNS